MLCNRLRKRTANRTIFAVLLASAAPAALSQPTTEAASSLGVEAAIYRAALAYVFRNAPQTERHVVVVAKQSLGIAAEYESKSLPPSLREDFAWRIPEASKEAVADLVRKQDGGNPIALSNGSLSRNISLLVLPFAELAPLATRDRNAWETFSSKHTGARMIFEVSAIGFDHQAGQALVYVGRRCDGLCGSGELLLLHQRSRVWSVISAALVWIS